eukprot:contig_23041_g5690
MRNPGIYPQPFPMFGDFWHAFTDNTRAYFEGRVLHTGLAWLQNANNRLVDVQEHIERGIVPPAAASEAVAVARTHVYQIYALLAARYECLLEQRNGAEWAHAMEAVVLNLVGPAYSNPATFGIHATAAAARFAAAAREYGRGGSSASIAFCRRPLPWQRAPPPFCARPIQQPPEVEAWGETEVQRWVANGFGRRATLAEQTSAQWTSATFVADVERKPRLVVALSPQNAYLYDRRFKYESIPAFVSMLKRGDHMASWDVADAFYHIRLAQREQLRLAFRVGKTLYVALTLPFGLKLAPWALTKLLRPVNQHLRSLGYLIPLYMDDFAISVDQPEPVSAAQATAAREFAGALFSRLGLHVHPTKGTATGTCRLEILGFLIDTESCLLILPPARRHKLVGAAHSLHGAAALDR